MDHSDEQPASQNHSHRLQQKQTDRVTGQLQCLNGPGNALEHVKHRKCFVCKQGKGSIILRFRSQKIFFF